MKTSQLGIGILDAIVLVSARVVKFESINYVKIIYNLLI